MTCKAEGCDRTDLYRRGECSLHYRRMQKYGTYDESALQKPGPKPDPRAPRSRHNPDNPTRSRPAKGREPKTHCLQGHEYSEENTYVSPEGFRSCKTCRRERMKERRPTSGVGAGGFNAAKTHCPKGHEYSEENTARYGNRRICRSCARENGAVQVIKKYGITRAQFDSMLEAQSGGCGVCRTPLVDRVCVDHDHACCSGAFACGQCVRGLLCGHCNTLLGFAKDDTDILRAAIEYLETR